MQRIFADDRDGSPHKLFIISTDGGRSLLVAHDLDLAPMHWTHDDPDGRHVAGYIEWRGRKWGTAS